MKALAIGIAVLVLAGCAANGLKVGCDRKLAPINAPAAAAGKVAK